MKLSAGAMALTLALVCALPGAAQTPAPPAPPPPAPPVERAIHDRVAAETFEDAQMAASTRAAVAFAQSAVRLSASDAALSALVRQRQDAEEQWRATDTARTDALAKGAAARDEAAALSARLASLEAEIRGQDAQLARRYPAFAELTDPSPLGLAAAQRLLRADEALVFILPAFDGTYVWAVRPTGVAWYRGAMDETEITKAVTALRQGLDAGDRPTPSPFDRAAAYKLYDQLWAPAAQTLSGARTVYVVTAGALSGLPMSVLPTAAPVGDDRDPEALRATPWLFQRYALATLPSVSSLRLVRALAGGRRASQPFAGFGDPALDGAADAKAPRGFGQYYRGGAADLEAVRSLPRLAGSRTELLTMARALGAPQASVVTGAAASEAAVRKADLSRTRVVAFATHGLLAGELDGEDEPALVLTPGGKDASDDGLLTASEAATLRLSADWIVLSACNTAAPDGSGRLAFAGEGLSGLARGFFYAGGKALLVSHWRVRDDAASAITTGAIEAHSRRPAGGRAAALQSAMNALLKDKAHPQFASPALWGPFVVVGDAG